MNIERKFEIINFSPLDNPKRIDILTSDSLQLLIHITLQYKEFAVY